MIILPFCPKAYPTLMFSLLQESQRILNYDSFKVTEAKSKLTVRFNLSKLNEYNDLRPRLAERLSNISEKGHVRILSVGPQVVLNFVESIIREKNLQLKLVDHLENWKNLSTVDPKSFDVSLLFDDNSESIKNALVNRVYPSNEKWYLGPP